MQIAVLMAVAAVALAPMAHAEVCAGDPAAEGIESCG